ncbi:MAG: hypothetical protein DMF31_11665 [Verrucomicrobia bacterium]|nr:MAG: hypothetical protein DMF31_11665 [Verrucomicrobiota bacterium]
MEPGEALSTAAQIAVTLAGFAGVVVVFRRESVHDWSPVDKLRLRLLLTNSILPLVLCMIGLLLLTILEMVQRIRIRGFPAVCHYNDEALSSPGSQGGTIGAAHPVRSLSVRNHRNSSKPLAVVQRGLPRRILAILHWDCRSTCHRHVPVCTHDSAATRIERGCEFDAGDSGEAYATGSVS